MGKYKGLWSVNDMYKQYPVTLPSIVTGGVITDFEYDGFIYRMHKFVELGADTLDISFISGGGNMDIDLLVVAGGGSGGQGNTTNANGGGGGGGVLYKTGHALALGSYNVFVGDGGAAIGDGVVSAGNNGENSFLEHFIAIGGGGGGGRSATEVGKDGGSGGGCALYNSSAPIYGSALQGDVDGATGYGNGGGQTAASYTGGGGGGAGSAGTAGGTVIRGDGGYGVLLEIEGVEKGYAGGGGGGANSSNPSGDGWHGGGRGFGSSTNYPTYTDYPDEVNENTFGHGTPDGIANTGGGGGGGSYYGNTNTWTDSGKGGSGIVIVRYKIGVVA